MVLRFWGLLCIIRVKSIGKKVPMKAPISSQLRIFRLMFVYALVDAMASQMYVDIFTSGFRISLSVVSLPVFLYFYKEVNSIKLSLFIASIGLLSRSMFATLGTGGFAEAMFLEYPTMVFDLSYGILFYFLYQKKTEKNDGYWFFIILFNDFFCNVLELIYRYGDVTKEVVQATVTLLVIASIRASMAIAIVTVIKYYRLLLVKEEHNERYKNLLLLTSDLKGETYFMKRNMDYIEDVMNSAYLLYEQMGQLSLPKDMKNLPLNIAKDVHEIKKDYVRVIRGLERIMSEETDYQHMSLKDLMDILVTTTRKSLPEEMADLDLRLMLTCDMKVQEHYLLISVLRNLVVNAQEALRPGIQGMIEIRGEQIGDSVEFTVRDNGMGIKEKHLKHIFDPGFSTKFSVTTGNISRGLGLTLVRDIIQERFNGVIEVSSITGFGTTFSIKIPRENLEATS